MAKEPFAAKLTSIWLGAIFFLVFKGFRGSLKDLIKKEYENRNLIVGYMITLIFGVLIVYLFFVK